MIRDMWNDGLVGRLLLALLAMAVTLLVVCVVMIPVAIHQENEWERWCASIGGHVNSTSHTNVAPAGKTVVVTNSKTSLCLSDDGRVLGVLG